MNYKLRIILCLIIISVFSIETSFSQCCAAGNPVSGDCSGGIDEKNILTTSLLYRHSFSDTYFDGNEISDYKYIDNSYFDFNSLSISYNLSNKLNIGIETGYFISKTQNFDFGTIKKSRKAFGLGDGALSLRYKFYQNADNQINVIPSFKLTLPIGVFDQIYESVLLPIDQQPSSGNYKYNIGVLVKKGLKGGRIALHSYAAIEISNRIKTDRTDYKYGNHYLFSILGSYAISKKVKALLQFRSQYRDRAENREITMESTGGHVIFLAPQLNLKLFKEWKLSMIFEKPIYKNMNGKQLTNNYAYVVKISHSLGINNKVGE